MEKFNRESYKYESKLNEKLSYIKNKIINFKNLKYYEKDLNDLEREITILHAKFANKIIKNSNKEIDLVGFHGQTIYHNSDEKISKQLGDGALLSQLIKKKLFIILEKMISKTMVMVPH